jgi:hypothetical protein
MIRAVTVRATLIASAHTKNHARHGLKFRFRARIDLQRDALQLADMAQATILSYGKNAVGAAQFLLERATQARRIAETLSEADADIARAYAAECEAEAQELLGWRVKPIAA